MKPIEQVLKEAGEGWANHAKYLNFNDPLNLNYNRVSYMYGWLQAEYRKAYSEKINTLASNKGNLWRRLKQALSRVKSVAESKEARTK